MTSLRLAQVEPYLVQDKILAEEILSTEAAVFFCFTVRSAVADQFFCLRLRPQCVQRNHPRRTQ
jgi:hypothetical protein